jgi:hypothetical protein
MINPARSWAKARRRTSSSCSSSSSRASSSCSQLIETLAEKQRLLDNKDEEITIKVEREITNRIKQLGNAQADFAAAGMEGLIQALMKQTGAEAMTMPDIAAVAQPNQQQQQPAGDGTVKRIAIAALVLALSASAPLPILQPRNGRWCWRWGITPSSSAAIRAKPNARKAALSPARPSVRRRLAGRSASRSRTGHEWAGRSIPATRQSDADARASTEPVSTERTIPGLARVWHGPESSIYGSDQ